MQLPLPKHELPEKVQRFGAPDAPVAAKTMAARGLVPLRGDDMITLLAQLSADADPGVASAARISLEAVPETVLQVSCASALHPAVLDALVPYVRDRQPLLEELAANRATPDPTVAQIARWADERTCERIATDQARVLGCPEIIEGLYLNRNTRMSTVDRLVELAARNDVDLRGVATFAAHVEAIQGQLIPDEPTDEPLPSDQMFSAALADDRDEDAIETDVVDGSEEIKKPLKPLAQRILDMSIAEKVRLALLGDAGARSILVRDPNKIVCMAAVTSPRMNEAEAARVAASKQVSEDVLRYVGNRRDWLGSYEVKKALTFNPRTPIGVSMKFLSHLRLGDLRGLARSKNVPAALRTAARQRAIKKQG